VHYKNQRTFFSRKVSERERGRVRESVCVSMSVLRSTKHRARCQFHQHFYEQFLLKQIPKAQKDTDDLTVFLRFWDLCVAKLLINMLIKLALVSILPTFYKHLLYKSVSRSFSMLQFFVCDLPHLAVFVIFVILSAIKCFFRQVLR